MYVPQFFCSGKTRYPNIFLCLGALFFALIAAPLACAQTLSSPESVRYDGANARFLISNRGAGEILARSSTGTLSVFTTDPASPAGIEIVGNLLYVADGSRVRSYRLDTGARIADYPIPGSSFLNGISSDGSNRLWVSDFSGSALYELDLSNPAALSHRLFIGGLSFSPNGLRFDAPNQRLLIVTWGTGRIFKATLDGTGLTQILAVGASNIDGVAIDCDGAVYVSSWGAQAIKRFEAPLTAASLSVDLVTGLSNPADIAYAPDLGQIASPNVGASTVSLHDTRCLGVMFRDRLEDR